MTITDTLVKDRAIADLMTGMDMRAAEPPLAPLAMPKQVLTRRARPMWRGLGALLSLLRRDLGRAG
ncbi:hypothetical protein [Pseudotabrizicola sp. 4114]|uniref:hypothetical protein n=1 Tax=Pseudotabrizicola sp. 4114 TaxID=2817731 RepID=UPI0032B81736